MKTLRTAGALSCAFALVGCQTSTTGGGGQSILDIIGGTSGTAADVVVDVEAACGIVENLHDVAALINVGVPGVSTAAGFADALCRAAQAKVGGARQSRSVTVVLNGVTVRGERR